jgi:S-adenosylmethionine hydrolase
MAVGRRFLVAPDNGLASCLGPASEAVTIDWRAMGLSQPSRTFHGRDIFAPAAALIARGEQLSALGDPVDPDLLVSNPLPDPEPLTSGFQATVISVDRFGNLATNLPSSSVDDDATASWSPGESARRVGTYSDGRPHEVVLLEGSAGYLELAVNGGSAAMATGLRRGGSVRIISVDEREE